MRRGLRLLLRSAVLVILCAAPLRAQVIFLEPCGLFLPQFSTTTLQIWVCVEGQLEGGITGVDFRVAGLPAGWLASAGAKPPYSLTGDLLGNGAVLSTNGCAAGVLWLEVGWIQVTALTEEVDVLLYSTNSDPPLPAPLNCPIATLCDAPAFTKICCVGTGTWMNGGGCPLAVETATWSEVKALYE